MGFYSRVILPRLLEKSMSSQDLLPIRKGLLSHAAGNVLEIGAGSGLNFSEYPPSLKTLTALDTNPGFNELLQTRIASSKIEVNHIIASVEQLPFSDNAFDTVVSTWTLCSIQNIDTALKEISRVLKPNGQLLFVEHGLSNSSWVRFFQHIMTPFWKYYKGGCHLNRPMRLILEQHGFVLTEYKEYNLPNTKMIARYTYQGIARKEKKVKA